MKQILKDIILIISWREMARQYFSGKSASWLYHKLDGIDGNGGETSFSDTEKEQLRNALLHLSERVKNAALSI